MDEASEERARGTARRLLTLLDEDGPGGLTIASTSLRPADLAAALDTLDERGQTRLFCGMPPDVAAQVLEEARPELRDRLFGESDDERLLRILKEAEVDDAVYFLDHLDEERAERLLKRMDEGLRRQLEEQWDLPDDAAGRLMTREVVTLRSFLTAGQAISRVRQMGETKPGSIYVVDADSRLVGTLGFRQLVFTEPNTLISTLMDRDVIAVKPETDREEVAQLLQKYHLLSVPVVDEERRIRGQVTWDDAVEVIQAEAEEDLLAIAGTAEQIDDNEGVFTRARLRLPWLLITAVGGFINAKVIAGFGASLSTQMLLVGFMPLVGAMGGNIGLQCSTVTVRALATGAIAPGHMTRAATREIATGALLAVLMAALIGTGGSLIALWTGDSPTLGVIMGVSLLLAILLAAVLGVGVPLACARLRIDPAIAAGPFITMLNDVSGYIIYIATVTVLLRAFA